MVRATVVVYRDPDFWFYFSGIVYANDNEEDTMAVWARDAILEVLLFPGYTTTL